MTVIDSSVAVDLLLGGGAGPEAERLAESEGELAAPDILVFEVVSVLRRLALHALVDAERASAAVADLADLPVDLAASMPLRDRAWELRENLTTADALFVALAERLDEPLVTKDSALAAAAHDHSHASVTVLAG